MMSPEVKSALIQAGCVVALALIGLIERQRGRLKRDNTTMAGDIAFQLEVEKIHCELHEERGFTSRKNIAREMARDRGFEWSGRFTPGRVRNP